MNLTRRSIFLNLMYEKEKALPQAWRKILPQYTNIELYLGKIVEYFYIVAREETYGTVEYEKIIEINVTSNEFNLVFMFPRDLKDVGKAIFSHKKYFDIANKGFIKSTYTKEIARSIYYALKKDEGGNE